MSYTSWIEAVKSVSLGEERKPGVWQTDSGNWAGKRPDGSTQYGMKGKEKAQAYVAGKDVEVDEPEKEPEAEPATGETTHTKASPAQQTEINKINAGVKEDLDFIIANAGDVRTQGGAGTNSASKKQVQDLGTFTEKRMAQGPDEEPYVHPDVVQREIDDATLDKSIDYLEESLGEEKFHKLIKFISKGGGVDPFLTKVRSSILWQNKNFVQKFHNYYI